MFYSKSFVRLFLGSSQSVLMYSGNQTEMINMLHELIVSVDSKLKNVKLFYI